VLAPSDGPVPGALILAGLLEVYNRSHDPQRSGKARLRFRQVGRDDQGIAFGPDALPSRDPGFAVERHTCLIFRGRWIAPEGKTEIMAHQSRHNPRAGPAAVEFLVPGWFVLVRIEGRPLLHPKRIDVARDLQ